MRRSPYDGEILRLALPALGALAAEPLYLLVDTAIVGHLGTPQLAALALAATVLVEPRRAVHLPDLRHDGPRHAPARRGPGRGAPPRSAPQAFWLALAVGVAVAAVVAALAAPLVHALGGDGHVADLRRATCASPSLGVPMALVALAGQGWLRGMGDLRTPLVIVVAANVVNVVLELLFVYGFDWGLDGSAWGTVLAQLGMGAAFAAVLLRAFAPRADLARIRSLVSIGAQLFVRTAALLACFVLATAVCARIGAATVAAHQIAFQLFGFLALVLDAIAIAGQVIVGRALGAGDADEAFAAARRMIELSLAAGLVIGGVFLALADVDPARLHLRPRRHRPGPRPVAAVLRCCGRWPPSSSRSTGSSSARATRATWPPRWSSPSSSSCRSC